MAKKGKQADPEPEEQDQEQEQSGQDDQDQQESPLGRLRGELGNYLESGAQHLVDKAGGKLSDLTDRLTDMAENGGGGVLGAAGSRILKGDSPVKAFVSEKAKSMASPVTDRVKGLFGGGGDGDDDSDGGGGGGSKSGGGDTKVTNIVETVDIGLPLRRVYDTWTQLEDFGTFTKGVRNVSKKEDTESDWKVKVGPSTRGWKATIQEMVPDERIVWTSEGAKGTTRGSISFHEITPTLTRIVAVIEYYPSGFFEKTGNLWRAQGRRLRLDLKHFVRYVTLAADEDIEGWRGEIRDGEVVRSHEEGLEDDERDENEEPEEEGDEEDEGEEDEEPDEDEEDEYDDEDEDGDEEGEDEDWEDEDGDDEDEDEEDADEDYDEDEYDDEEEEE